MFAKHYEKVTWKHINNSAALLKKIEEKSQESFYYDTFSSWYKKLNRSFKQVSDKCYDLDVYNKNVAHFFKLSEECIKKLSSLYSKDHFYYSHELVTILINNLWNGQYIHTDGEVSISDVEEVISLFKEKYDLYIYDLSHNQSEIEQIFARADELEEDIRLLKNNLKGASTTKKAQIEQKIGDLKAEYNTLRKQADDYCELNEQIKLKNHLGDIILTSVKTNNPENAYILNEQAKDLEKIEAQKEETRKAVKDVKSNKLVKNYSSDFDEKADEEEVTEKPSLNQTKPSVDLDKLHPLLQEMNQKLDKLSSSNERMESGMEDIKTTVHRSEDKLDKLAIEVSKLSVDELVKRLSELFTANVKREESGEEDASSNEEILVYEAELARRNISCRETVNTLIGLNPPDFIGAYSNIRTLIDSYCRYVHGIELDNNHRLFNPKLVSTNPAFAGQTFYYPGKTAIFNNIIFSGFRYKNDAGKNCNSIYDIYNKCSENVHISIESLLADKNDQIKQIKGMIDVLVDTALVDYPQINYVEGVKKLYENEVRDLNRFVDGDYVIEELSSARKGADAAKNIYKDSLGRINLYKQYLQNNAVEEDFFNKIGNPKPFIKEVSDRYSEIIAPKPKDDDKPQD